MTDRLESLLNFHPFTRLNTLLQGIEPGATPLALSVGEPQAAPPEFLAEILERHKADWSRYPQSAGTPDFRVAVADWLTRRYRLPEGLIDRDAEIMPCAGSREALFHLALAAVPEWQGQGARPVVLMPNPFYHVYAGAAAVAGAEPVFLPATAGNGFLPEPESVPPEVLSRTALAYVCSPSNPQGAIASRDYLARWLALARRHGFTIAFDECYAEIYRDQAPAGALEVADGSLENLVVLHSLSKRSSAPGLRSGFIAGDRRLIRRVTQLVNFGGVAPSFPALAASAALWRDEVHVEAARARYRRCFAIAERLIGQRFGFVPPAGGFFLWLDVGDGEAAARRLWAEAGIRVLPGAYMARPDSRGVNPGHPYIRVALVHEPEIVERGLAQLVAVLEPAEAEAAS
ncbi:MAG: N-succinyldiaminopimelate aminotransferase [Rhodospirillaceae bacterium]|nr:N-succinyldiaminopimelate aminotransferase [Rhodospirillaceae bacterium]